MGIPQWVILLAMFNEVPLKTRRALSLYKFYGISALCVLKGTSLNIINALLVLRHQYCGLHTNSPCLPPE